jgi:putative membrane protein
LAAEYSIQTELKTAADGRATPEVKKMSISRISGLVAAIFLATAIGPAHAADKPSDAQIAHIAYTGGSIDIKNAKLALTKSKNADVRAFANDMLRDHTAVNDKALALVKKLHVTPKDNATSKSLVKQQDDERAKLSKLSGAAFDKAYIDNEVAFHKTVIGALETTLIPSAQNAELKNLLQTGVKIFQGHEQHAEQLASSLK